MSDGGYRPSLKPAAVGAAAEKIRLARYSKFALSDRELVELVITTYREAARSR